ncbi:MAG: restriction endonuclease subunit S [Candidatus Competibacteraceae bacterium]
MAFCVIKDTKEKITESGYRNASTEIHPTGTVMLAMIGEGKTRGQVAILRVPAAHNQNTAAIRVSEAGCISEYVYFYLLFQYELTRRLGSGNNQKALNKDRVSNMRMPFCSVAEQEKLVQILDEKLSVLDQLEQTLTQSQQHTESLRQSILKKAFSGQLVPQDPNDEPASILLERIKAEKANQIKGDKPKTGRKKLKVALTVNQ